MFMSSTKHMYVSCTVCVCVDCGGQTPCTNFIGEPYGISVCKEMLL